MNGWMGKNGWAMMDEQGWMSKDDGWGWARIDG